MSKLDELKTYANVEILGQSQAEAADTCEWAAGEIERLKGEAYEARRGGGIWSRVDAKGSEGLAVWYDGDEKVVARDAADALAVWAEHNGCKPEEHGEYPDAFERVPDDEEIGIGLGDDGAGPSARLTAKCWALLSGRAWLCSESF